MNRWSSLAAHRNPRCAPGPSSRVLYLDNIRAFLIILVVLHHVAVGLGAPGVWYIKEQMSGAFSSSILTLFVSVNQAFFMSLLFLVAGYHSWVSCNKHGAGRFLLKRTLRLGIPLALYDLVLNPAIVIFIVKNRMTPVPEGPILTAIVERFLTIGSGPAWFLERLLIFSVIFAICMYFFRPVDSEVKVESEVRALTWPFVLVLLLAIIQFSMKTWFPPTRELAVAGIDFPFFPPRYIAMFLVGVWAARTAALDKITIQTGWIWLSISFVATLLLYGYIQQAIVGSAPIALESGTTFLFALWENTLAIGLSISVLVLFRERLNDTGAFAAMLARSSYAVYLCHAPVLVVMAIVIPAMPLPSLAMFLLMAPVALVLSFTLGRLLVAVPLRRLSG